MATKRNAAGGVRKEAQTAATKDGTRNRVRDLTVRALRDRTLDRSQVSALVHDVLAGASAAVDKSIPASRRSVLRQVFDGLGDAFTTVSSAGVRTAQGVRKRERVIAEHAVPAASRRLRTANDEFLAAVSSFSKRASSEVGEELDALVKRARRTGGQVADTARGIGKAADGRLLELTGETARAGVGVVRRAAAGLVSAASGLLQGVSEAVSPRKTASPAPRPATRRRKAGTKTRTAAKRK